VFKTKQFENDLLARNHLIKFSGVGAHHQNGITERAIQDDFGMRSNDASTCCYTLAASSLVRIVAICCGLCSLHLELFTQRR
jgi:hypothetical protein